jgi:hypothetical protein
MSMLGRELAQLYGRELDHLAEEIAAIPDEGLWSTTGAQKNAPGTLALHTVGGLMHFVGAAIGGSGYVRDREREFSERAVPRDELMRRIRACRDTVVPILEGLDDDALERPMPGPLPPFMQGATVRAFLMHLLWHLGWHLGHVYYHRLGSPGRTPA